MPSYEEIREQARRRQELCMRIKSIIVDRLGLDIEPALITDDQPLFGRGLNLDSIDTLELVVGIEAEFDVTVTDDNTEMFGSINKIADFIVKETAGECYNSLV